MALGTAATNCVVFVGASDGPPEDGNIRAGGTAFLFEGGQRLGGGRYLVTALHVARQLQQRDRFAIRLNRAGGARCIEIESATNRWYTHEDGTVDLALMPFQVPDWAEATYYSADHSLFPDKMEEKGIGPGDPVYVVGLFHLLQGQRRNLPMVHRGQIACIPGEERIPVDGIGDVEGYLVEAHSLSGCSGSPVFAGRTLGINLAHEASPALMAYVQGSIWLLGIWQSSWKVRDNQLVAVSADVRGGGEAPLGMGVVVPFLKLAEIFEQHDELRPQRALLGNPPKR